MHGQAYGRFISANHRLDSTHSDYNGNHCDLMGKRTVMVDPKKTDLSLI